MTVLLAHPYSSALFFWFAELDGASIADPDTRHPYYRALFRQAREHIDVALTAAVVFEDIVIPAVDAPFPGRGWNGDGRLPELGLTAEWDPVHEAREILQAVEADVSDDAEVARLLRALPEADRDLELHYAVADLLLMDAHRSPLLCSPGRFALVERLWDLGVYAAPEEVMARSIGSGDSFRRDLDVYAELGGLTFRRDRLEGIADVKQDLVVSDYAKEFRRALERSSTGASPMMDALTSAMSDQNVRAQATGLFATWSRLAGYLGTVSGPLLGPVLGGLSSGLDAVALGASRARRKSSWYELAPTIRHFQSVEDLRKGLEQHGEEAVVELLTPAAD